MQQGDLLSSAYVSDHDQLVSKSGASLWIHGHVHASSDYVLGDTRVVCNPRGYPGEPVDGFQLGLIVEVATDAATRRR